MGAIISAEYVSGRGCKTQLNCATRVPHFSNTIFSCGWLVSGGEERWLDWGLRNHEFPMQLGYTRLNVVSMR